MKQLNFFRKFMPSLIVYYLYLMVNETSYMIVKTFTSLHIYRSSSPSDKRGWGRGSDTPGNILRRTFFDALKTGVLRAGHTNNKCLRTVITN